MECNRDEAIRAKTIAEKKLADKDFAGAKKFTLKAQTLYPELDGISQMLITLNVYISSENKKNGESDWYGVLDVKPSDDDETIRKQYRKLVLMLHPDKNKSVGADGAFKILSEAWSLLSDKSKRLVYNQRRNSRILQQKVSPQRATSSSSSSSSPHGVNVVPDRVATPKPRGWHSTSTTQTGPTRAQAPRPARAQARAQAQTPPPAQAQARARPPARAPPLVQARGAPSVVHGKNTFWTVCFGCKVHYEYHKVYLNHTILCAECHKPFHAIELAAPVNLNNNTNIRFSRSVCGDAGPSGPSKTASNLVEKVRGMKRQCEEFNAQRLLKRRF